MGTIVSESGRTEGSIKLRLQHIAAVMIKNGKSKEEAKKATGLKDNEIESGIKRYNTLEAKKSPKSTKTEVITSKSDDSVPSSQMVEMLRYLKDMNEKLTKVLKENEELRSTVEDLKLIMESFTVEGKGEEDNQ